MIALRGVPRESSLAKIVRQQPVGREDKWNARVASRSALKSASALTIPPSAIQTAIHRRSCRRSGDLRPAAFSPGRPIGRAKCSEQGNKIAERDKGQSKRERARVTARGVCHFALHGGGDCPSRCSSRARLRFRPRGRRGLCFSGGERLPRNVRDVRNADAIDRARKPSITNEAGDDGDAADSNRASQIDPGRAPDDG